MSALGAHPIRARRISVPRASPRPWWRGRHAACRTRKLVSQRPKLIHGYGLNVTIFRPSVIFGRGDSFLSMFARLLKLSPVLPLAGASARFAPVHVDDVARAFADSLDNPRPTVNYELCGPKVYTCRNWCATWEVTGTKRSIIPLGDGLSYLQPGRWSSSPARS